MKQDAIANLQRSLPPGLTGRRQRPLRRLRQAGVSLVTAIFLIVVLSALAVAMVSLFSVQQQQSALDVQGARAYQAARAGIEWGLYQHLRNGLACGGVATSFALPAGNSLSNFVVTVVCVQTPAGTVTATTRRQLTAIACNQPGAGSPGSCPNPGTSADYVQRKVQVEF